MSPADESDKEPYDTLVWVISFLVFSAIVIGAFLVFMIQTNHI